MKKRIGSLVLAVTLCLGLAVTASAADTGKLGEQNLISVGGEHAAMIDANGSLWIWGVNWNGQLGNGTKEDSSTPVKVLDNVAFVSCGSHHAAAIKTDGTLWTWGREDTAPEKVLDGVACVSCGWDYTAAIKTDGSLWTWGDNEYGQLGDGTMERRESPVKVLDDVASVSCGGFGGLSHTAAIKTDGTLWVWGNNKLGQLGNGWNGNLGAASEKFDGNTLCQTVPVKIMDDVASVSVGNAFTMAVKTDGSLWGWGNSVFGNLGNGGTGDKKVDMGSFGIWPFQTTPVKVMDGVAAVRAGGEDEPAYSVIVKYDGSVWVCGLAMLGSIGAAAPGAQTITLGGETGQFHLVPARIPSLSFAPTAYASTQNVLVDGKTVEFPCYALKDANGNDTNYVKLRGVAQILNGTSAQFEVTWDGAVNIVTGRPYTANGTELSTPFSGDRSYTVPTAQTRVNGQTAALDAIILTDDAGNGYTYYKLRDLGAALGFTVDWSAEKGIFIETE